MPLRTLNAMQLVEPDLIIKSVTPLFSTSVNSIYLALNVNIKQQSIPDEKAQFIHHLYESARAFITMVGAFCFSKIDRTLRENFIKDFKCQFCK